MCYNSAPFSITNSTITDYGYGWDGKKKKKFHFATQFMCSNIYSSDSGSKRFYYKIWNEHNAYSHSAFQYYNSPTGHSSDLSIFYVLKHVRSVIKLGDYYFSTNIILYMMWYIMCHHEWKRPARIYSNICFCWNI